jgi:predicted hydrolase (HD superfamily)
LEEGTETIELLLESHKRKNRKTEVITIKAKITKTARHWGREEEYELLFATLYFLDVVLIEQKEKTCKKWEIMTYDLCRVAKKSE